MGHPSGCGEWSLGLAEFFGQLLAVLEGYCVETVEDLDVDDEGDEGESEKDGDHEPGAAEIVGQRDDDEGNSEAGNEDA